MSEKEEREDELEGRQEAKEESKDENKPVALSKQRSSSRHSSPGEFPWQLASLSPHLHLHSTRIPILDLCRLPIDAFLCSMRSQSCLTARLIAIEAKGPLEETSSIVGNRVLLHRNPSCALSDSALRNVSAN